MKQQYITKSILKKVYPKKDPWSHKGDYGRLLVVAGSYRMTGAPVLIGLAALRTGLDTIYFVGPERSMNVVANAFPTFINLPLEGNQLEEKHVEKVLHFAQEMRITALAMGPGLYRTQETRNVINQIVENLDVPMVLDADAIRAVSSIREKLKTKNVIVTPHSDEFKELTGIKPEINLKERISVVKDQAKKLGITILLKGNIDIISDGKKVAINKTGNPFMTKGGLGDTMTGICAAFIARRVNKVDNFTAACATAYINGRAGDLAGNKYGISLLPTDVINEIAEVLRGK